MEELAKLGHKAFETPDLEESLWFFRDMMRMKIVAREGDTAYLCALQDYEHHTMSLTEGDRGAVDHIGFRAQDPESVEEFGRDVWWIDEGQEAGIGESVMFESEADRRFEIYYEMDKPDIDGEQRSNIPMRRYSPEHANRVYPQRIDHTHVQDGSPEATVRLFEEEFDMGLNEVFKSEDGTTWGGGTRRPRSRTTSRSIASRGTRPSSTTSPTTWTTSRTSGTPPTSSRRTTSRSTAGRANTPSRTRTTST